MTNAEREALLDAYLAERQANPEPTKKEWRDMLDRYGDEVNVESLLNYGAAQGWLG